MQLPKFPAPKIDLQIGRELMAVAGAASFTYGVWLAWAPAGYMIGGLALMSPFVLRNFVNVIALRGRR